MILAISILLLLVGTFVLRSIRWGALAAILLQVATALYNNDWSTAKTAALVDGLTISFELGMLLFGAVSFYLFLRVNNRLDFLDRFAASSPNAVYLLITYCMFLGTFFEGIAGFGIPPILLIPLMVASGFKPVTAIVSALCGSVNAVIFGALGAPLIIGLGITQPNDVIRTLMILNAASFVAMPFLLTWIYGVIEKVPIDWRRLAPMLGGAGILYCVLFTLSSRLPVEYPSVATGAIGMILFMAGFNPAVRSWGIMFWIRSFWPYMILIVFLVMGKALVQRFTFTLPGGNRAISAYQPGVVFLISIGIIALIFAVHAQTFQIAPALRRSGKRAMQSLTTIVLLVTVAQLVRSEIVEHLGAFIARQSADVEPLLLLLFGVSGAFITGSATMSNVLLGGMLASVTTHITLATAMLHTGSVLGNVIALQNVVMARSALEEDIPEAEVLRYSSRLLLVCILLVLASAAVWQGLGH